MSRVKATRRGGRRSTLNAGLGRHHLRRLDDVDRALRPLPGGRRKPTRDRKLMHVWAYDPKRKLHYLARVLSHPKRARWAKLLDLSGTQPRPVFMEFANRLIQQHLSRYALPAKTQAKLERAARNRERLLQLRETA